MKTNNINSANEPLHYFAFISYSHEDEKWAIQLQHEIEYYQLPASLNGREDLPKEFRPVFRDKDELKAGNLTDQIHEALDSSTNLIVICSPCSAKSVWVNNEISYFIETGNRKGINNLERVFPFIIEGKPKDCLPKVLRDLPDDKERLGSNVHEIGFNKAFIKIIAGMLPNVRFDILWNRFERDKAEEEIKKREERNKLLIMQSRFVSEKAKEVMYKIFPYDKGKAACLALEVLPKVMEYPERPYVSEAECVLREALFECTTLVEIKDIGRCNAVSNNVAVFSGYSGPICTPELSEVMDIKAFKMPPEHNTIRIYDIETGEKMNEYFGSTCNHCLNFNGLMVSFSPIDNSWGLREAATGKRLFSLYEDNREVCLAAFSPDNSLFATVTGTLRTKSPHEVRIWETKTGACKQIINGHTKDIKSLKFGHDSNSVITSSIDGIRIWDINTGRNTYTIQEENICCYRFADFIPHTNLVAYIASHKQSSTLNGLKTYTYYCTLHLYNIEEKKPQSVIELCESYINIDSLIVDNDNILIFGEHLEVCDFNTGCCKLHLSKNLSLIQQQGQTFKVLHKDGTLIKVVSFDFLPLKEIMRLAKEKYGDKVLTDEEKKKYFIIN